MSSANSVIGPSTQKSTDCRALSRNWLISFQASPQVLRDFHVVFHARLLDVDDLDLFVSLRRLIELTEEQGPLDLGSRCPFSLREGSGANHDGTAAVEPDDAKLLPLGLSTKFEQPVAQGLAQGLGPRRAAGGDLNSEQSHHLFGCHLVARPFRLSEEFEHRAPVPRITDRQHLPPLPRDPDELHVNSPC